MKKSYIDCLKDITADELYEGLLGYGMFTEKLPPIFTSHDFYQYCKNHKLGFNKNKGDGFILYESMRNTSIPRTFGIPTPMKYEILCHTLKDNWDAILNVFEKNTKKSQYKVSRIHIRKRKGDKALIKINYENNDDEDYIGLPTNLETEGNKKSLFNMNYKNWEEDGDPITQFFLGKKYVVMTDISQCFPSIYTHSLCWALAGKSIAKAHKKGDWYNDIDIACQGMRNGETHGLLIGPHASNLLSEIILTAVDKELIAQGYEYIRNIDDYTCYVESFAKAQQFIVDLNSGLREYDLFLNHKKTMIKRLPQAASESWIQKLKNTDPIGRYGVVDYKSAMAYLDVAVRVMKDNGNNASAIYYAIKVLGKKKISNNAKICCVRTMCHLAVIYPYLVPIMDRYVFEAFNASQTDIEKFANILYHDSFLSKNYEGLSYALYFAIKYKFLINEISIKDIVSSSNCVYKVLSYVYFKTNNNKKALKELKEDARSLKKDSFEENWLFIYEALPKSDMSGDWSCLKKQGISFLVDKFT